jgi:hypothetical protein
VTLWRYARAGGRAGPALAALRAVGVRCARAQGRVVACRSGALVRRGVCGLRGKGCGSEIAARPIAG